MNNIIKILACVIPFLQLEAQYLGGNMDGFSNQASGMLTLNDQSFYCNGGNKDGYSLDTSGFMLMMVQTYYCDGGNGNGYGTAGCLTGPLYDQSKYCSGGNNDGYNNAHHSQGTFNIQTFYCSGGNGDGYKLANISPTLLFDQAKYCSGGNRDGYFSSLMPLDSLGNGIWTGSVSSSWETPGNWTHNVIPTESDLVYIPSGCVYYPYLTSGLSVNDTGNAYKCKSLEIQSGAEMGTLNSSLSVYGRMIVAGNFTATNNTNLSQNIYSGGSLNILNSGIVRFGNQSSGNGYADLAVFPGGVLIVDGGVLEIDDQLNIMGCFNMTGGYVFAHKYGAGSAITVISGPFNVAPGASGNVSGGIVRVCGKKDNNFPAIALNDPDFDFTGSSTLLITNGVSNSKSDVAIKTANGSALQNLLVSKPGYNVNLSSDMVIKGQLSVMQDAALRVPDGFTLDVKGGAK